MIIGGDSESCFLALYIAGRGAEVHVVEPKTVFSRMTSCLPEKTC